MATPRTRTSDAAERSATPAAAEADLGSAAQRERRKRILDATLALASKGGYDAVQMRAVAERADVALGTLYRDCYSERYRGGIGAGQRASIGHAKAARSAAAKARTRNTRRKPKDRRGGSLAQRQARRAELARRLGVHESTGQRILREITAAQSKPEAVS